MTFNRTMNIVALALALALGSTSAFTGVRRQTPVALAPSFKRAVKAVAPALKVRVGTLRWHTHRMAKYTQNHTIRNLSGTNRTAALHPSLPPSPTHIKARVAKKPLTVAHSDAAAIEDDEPMMSLSKFQVPSVPRVAPDTSNTLYSLLSTLVRTSDRSSELTRFHDTTHRTTTHARACTTNSPHTHTHPHPHPHPHPPTHT